DFAAGLERLRQAGYTIVTTSSHAGQSVFSTKLPAKVVIVFGEEKGGISDDTLQQGDLALSIPGTGHVESLNVSVATGILLGEWWRQHGVQAEFWPRWMGVGFACRRCALSSASFIARSDK
ncbi:MAG: TrmH family RNA methyltransferase, partial [Plesiomonas shigelloides]